MKSIELGAMTELALYLFSACRNTSKILLFPPQQIAHVMGLYPAISSYLTLQDLGHCILEVVITLADSVNGSSQTAQPFRLRGLVFITTPGNNDSARARRLWNKMGVHNWESAAANAEENVTKFAYKKRMLKPPSLRLCTCPKACDTGPAVPHITGSGPNCGTWCKWCWEVAVMRTTATVTCIVHLGQNTLV